MDAFFEAVERVKRAYQDLGHQLGWRFLYSPASTLSGDTQMLLVGSAPGGRHYGIPIASVEEGSVYRVEAWGAGGEPTPLQIQVRSLFGMLSRKLELPSVASLMDETLTSNFCPFRTPSWDSLHKREESISFSTELWLFLFDYISPKVVI